MCGIICGIGSLDIAQVVLQGLKRLEYRGYDSAGISFINEQILNTRKHVGKVDGLLAKTKDVQSYVAIAHTRWATHGPANLKNAHPHVNANCSWVHNGIINNHSNIRTRLQQSGFNFQSDTDSEVMGMLFESNLSDDPITALQACYHEFNGSFAWGLIHTNFPDKMFFSSKNSPLVFGASSAGSFIASDPLALLGVCDIFYIIPSGTIGWCSKDEYQILCAETLAPVCLTEKTELTANHAKDKKQKHYMLQEIYEQPEACERFLNQYWSQAEPSNELKEIADNIPSEIKMLQTIGCGSSYFAALIGKHWFNELTELLVCCDIASEFKDQNVSKIVPTMLLALSQSGETADTLAAFDSKNFYDLRMSLCNVPHSTLARSSDFMLPILAGTEVGVASTKAFTNQLLSLLLLAIAKNPEHELGKYVGTLPSLLKQTIGLEHEISEIANKLRNEQNMLFLGRGILYPTALEGALKLKELTYIHAHAYPAGELKHGPLALIDDQLVTVGLLCNGPQRSKTIANFREIQARHGRLVVFYQGEESDLKHLNIEHKVRIPASKSYLLSPLMFSVSLQLFAYHFAVSLGKDIDQPRNLAKAVTVE